MLPPPIALFIIIFSAYSASSSSVVEATYSIVATDASTRQVGGAGATCLPSEDVYHGLYLSVPNASVLHTQGLLLERDSEIVTTALDMMTGRNNETIDAILGKMWDLDTPYDAELRQYGMADFNDAHPSHGGYTGTGLDEIYELFGIHHTQQIDMGVDRNDEDVADESIRGRYSFHAQGNVVAEGTVASLHDGFLGGGGDDDGDDRDPDEYCDMAGRLMSAMGRVIEGNGLGDMRCINNYEGVSATGAFLHVDNPDGTPLIHINKIGDGSFEPVEALRREFLEWRRDNPCPCPGDAAGERTPGDATILSATTPTTKPVAPPVDTASEPEVGVSGGAFATISPLLLATLVVSTVLV